MSNRRTGPDRTIGIAGWLAVLALLVLIDLVVRWVYVPTWIPRLAESSGDVLHDVTLGRSLTVVFTAAEQRIAAAPRALAIVGDSTIMGEIFHPSRRFTPALASEIAAARGPAAEVSVIELGFLGLTTLDASVVIAKALALGADLVVYAVTPRTICRLTSPATDASRYALDPGVRSRLGLPYLVEEFPLATLAGSAVASRWALFRYQRELHDEVLGTVARRAPESWRRWIAPTRFAANIGSEPAPLTGPLWTHERCPLDDASREVIALRKILDVCADDGRCVVYHGPVNPDAASSFETDLLPRFRALVARLAAERHVPFHDYADELSSDFFWPRLIRPDAIHLNANGRAWLAKRLAADVHDLIPRRIPH